MAEHGPREIFFKNLLLTWKYDSCKETTTGPIEQEVGWTPQPVGTFEHIVGVLCLDTETNLSLYLDFLYIRGRIFENVLGRIYYMVARK